MPRKSLFFIFLFVCADQLVKYMITFAFLVGSSIEILPFFHITYLTNTGIAFSLFQGGNVYFIVLSLIIIAVLGYWYAKNFENLPKRINFSLILIFSGAIGNLIDRVFRGHVVDFLDFSIGAYHWPAFNLADSFISLGGILLLISFFTLKERIRTVII